MISLLRWHFYGHVIPPLLPAPSPAHLTDPNCLLQITRDPPSSERHWPALSGTFTGDAKPSLYYELAEALYVTSFHDAEWLMLRSIYLICHVPPQISLLSIYLAALHPIYPFIGTSTPSLPCRILPIIYLIPSLGLESIQSTLNSQTCIKIPLLKHEEYPRWLRQSSYAWGAQGNRKYLCYHSYLLHLLRIP